MHKKNIIRIIIATGIILLIVLIAMQFTSLIDWNLGDFAMMGALLLGSGLLYDFLANKARDNKQRMIIGIIMAALVILAWVELAVGIFGSPFAGS